MIVAAATQKGAATREMIVERAYDIARRDGLEGVSIGELATATGMSKSGVFAHFGSREDLLRTVLDWAGTRFVEQVLHPALKQPRGLPRLRAVIANWAEWIEHNSEGCVILGAAVEFDGRPGRMREDTAKMLQRWQDSLEHAVQLAIDTGELRSDCDAGLIAFQILALMQGMHHARMYQRERAHDFARRAIDALLQANAA